MKNLLLVTIGFLLTTITAKTQTLNWAKSFGDTLLDKSNIMITDAAGNIYVAGYFRGTVDFDPGAATSSLTSYGSSDIYLHKLTPAGDLIWVRQMGGPGQDEAYFIAQDTSGNLYLSGYFQDTADFDPGPNTFNLEAAGAIDGFVTKLTPAGDFVWARAFRATGLDQVHFAVPNMLGEVYVSGSFYDTIDLDPGPGVVEKISAGGTDIYLVKLDASGNFDWGHSYGGTSAENTGELILDDSGNVYMAGSFFNTIDFDPGPGTSSATSAGISDAYLAKYTEAGALVWAKTFGGADVEGVVGMSFDSHGNLVLVGQFQGTTDLDPGPGTAAHTAAGQFDGYTLKLDHDGNYLWSKAIGGPEGDVPYIVVVDDSNNLYMTGSFGATVDFDPGPGTFNLTSAGSADAYVTKLDSSGNLVWAIRFGDSGIDIGSSLSLDNTGAIVCTGWFLGTIDADPGSGVHNLTSASAAHQDYYVIKFGGTTGVEDIHSEPLASKVYPNPSTGTVRIQAEQKISNIRIVDLSGRLIFTASPETRLATIDHLQPGIYFVTIESAGRKETRKLIIH